MTSEVLTAPSLLHPVPAGPVPAIPPPQPRREIQITVNGRELSVPEGTTLLEATRRLDIDTPTLCYLENLTPVNVCRICVVEVEGARTLVPACSRKAEPGMKVRTDSERVRLSRRLVIELLASSVDVSTAPS
ncbi:MAG: 2Fe-2S iron-sulfur cluster-binding protein, partial [Gammaproteobacteria bacterium]